METDPCRGKRNLHRPAGALGHQAAEGQGCEIHNIDVIASDGQVVRKFATNEPSTQQGDVRTGSERCMKTTIVDEIIDRKDPIARIALQWQPNRIGTQREHQRSVWDDPIIQNDCARNRVNPYHLALGQDRGLNCLSRGGSRRARRRPRGR